MRTLKLQVRLLAEPLSRGLLRLGITANQLTVTGSILNAAAGIVAASGLLTLAGLLYLAFSALDFLDGSVARLSGTVGPFGAFLDSVLDRLSEAAILVGLTFLFAAQDQPIQAALAGIVLTGSFLVSYARARAEGLGFECEVGWGQRPERIVLLSAGMIFSPLHALLLPSVLGVLAVATMVTTVQRIRHVALLARAREAG